MMEAARKRKFKAIIVYRLDRISRNISDFAGLIDELSRLEIAFVSIKEQFDTGTPMGRAMMYIASVFSQLERETIAERIRDNMYELAKTGRWLGGTTPTGYGSESVKSVTVDGKSKKACKLKLIPEEAKIVKAIFDLYLETDSQTITEAELIKRGIRTKNNKYFTRFSIKAILQNPVYMIADEEAYNYFVKAESALFSEKEAFDGVHGIMAYNRTSQEKGKTTEYLSPKEWIIAVGLHSGIIPGRIWVQVQESLDRNKSKAYRKPRSNEALLTGLLYCSCGSRMYPKLSGRRTADGKPGYTYVCKMKERSQRTVCSGRNANGNIVDKAVIEQVKMIGEDKGVFTGQLERNRKFHTGNRAACEEQLASMRQEKADMEKKIEGLVDSLTDLGDGAVRNHVVKRIEQLGVECAAANARLQELEGLTSLHAMSNMELDVMCQLLAVFESGIEKMTIEQKRTVIRATVRKAVWDGVNVHVALFGVKDDEIDFLDRIGSGVSTDGSDSDIDEPYRIGDGDYDDENVEEAVRRKTNTFHAPKTHWGEDSK